MNDYEVDKFAWQRAIFELPLPAVTKLTALVMSIYANKDGTNCHPGIARLAGDVGISDRRLPGHLRTLRDIGVVQLVKQGGGRGSHLADEYSLIWSNETADLVDKLVIQRTKRPLIARDTTDATSDESSNTTDVETNTTDVGADTTDVESFTKDVAASPHQATNTSPISPGTLSPFSDSTAAPTSPSPNDKNDREFDSARTALASLAPVVMEKLLDDAIQQVGADDMRAVVIRAAELVSSRTAVAS